MDRDFWGRLLCFKIVPADVSISEIYCENTLSFRLYFSCQGVLHWMSGAT